MSPPPLATHPSLGLKIQIKRQIFCSGPTAPNQAKSPKPCGILPEGLSLQH
jgi:hypothetical protein